MKLYRIDKLAKRGGMVLKKKHILAPTDAQAVRQAEDSDDCPVCDVVRDGELTIRGITRPITLDATFEGAVALARGPRAKLAFSASGQFDRRE